MAHHTYTTSALVLGLHPYGEDSRVCVLYTKEVGLVHAVAKSIRTVRSKLRCALQTYSSVEVSLVHGREIWRVTGAREIKSYYFSDVLTSAQQATTARIFSLTRRLIAGEESHPELFDKLVQGLETLSRPGLSSDYLESIECVVVLQMLHALGYVSEPDHIRVLVSSAFFAEGSFGALTPLRHELIAHINRGLKAAQL
jgi:DNA repair protein RecO